MRGKQTFRIFKYFFLIFFELKEFHFKLENTTSKQKRIPRGKLERNDSMDTARLLTAHYGHMEALQVTIQTLRNINQNNLALELERDTVLLTMALFPWQHHFREQKCCLVMMTDV
uniref:Pyrin domain-containing protein n=1 Tax=Amphiprion ocellaris TaxID=80972 RepID=A0A3Q1AJA7_AMPOC